MPPREARSILRGRLRSGALLWRRLGDVALMEEALVCMPGAIEVYRQTGASNRLPIAESRVIEIEAELAKMKKCAIRRLAGAGFAGRP